MGFFNAIGDYAEALRLVSRLKLWIYFLIPSLISLIVGIGILVVMIHLGDNFGLWLGGLYPFDWGASWAVRISQWLGYLLMAIMALFLFRYIIIIFLAPVLSPLSLKVEKYLRDGQIDNTWSMGQLFREFQRSLRINIRNLLRELMFTILLFLLHFIPVIGWFSSIFIFLVQAYYSGFGNMDFTLERHLGYKQSISFVRANRSLAIGNGTIFILMLMIPLLGLLLAPPLAVVAATMGTVKALKEGRLY